MYPFAPTRIPCPTLEESDRDRSSPSGAAQSGRNDALMLMGLIHTRRAVIGRIPRSAGVGMVVTRLRDSHTGTVSRGIDYSGSDRSWSVF